MSQFKREARYAVFKLKDMLQYLTQAEISELYRMGGKIAARRRHDGRPPLNAVVVEQDWPEFEMVWASIERRMSAEEKAPTLTPVCCRCLENTGPLFPANCEERPESLRGAPIGMYHCPDCGAMVVAGVPHGDMCQKCLDRNHPAFDKPKESGGEHF